ncbi:DUF4255 domain-containing protein [Spirosoma sp. HMF4905]|uniref:DUF4255 domain-containing protein n=1 Tax=Spirosoma arboris TaxID=2682092 RepID=A0A7K1SIA5_9BACT|nr:DUF4255 domain-containing protein [Spirosoma arboris]MVM33503.1 DUF4255 domain-containing protein [Spirosoma arboris]
MIAHALSIIVNELNRHLQSYNLPEDNQVDANQAVLGNLAEGLGSGGSDALVPRDRLVLSVVNIREEKTLKNLPNYVRNDAKLSVTYENPPIFLNFQILMASTHIKYPSALLMLSRGLQFFQYKKTFTQENVDPDSLNPPPALTNQRDQLEVFKLIFDLYSPTVEEINYLWGTLGGKQYPFALYTLRMLDLKFKAVLNESGLITDVVSDFYHKKPVRN